MHRNGGVTTRCITLYTGRTARGAARHFSRVRGVTQRQKVLTTMDSETHGAAFAVDRATGDLRRGGLVVVTDASGATAALSAEYATPARLARLDSLPGGQTRLILTARRAQALGYLPRDAAVPVVALTLPPPLDPELIYNLADPSAAPANTPRHTSGLTPALAHARDTAAVSIARIANLLPAVLARSLNLDEDIEAWTRRNNMMHVDLADLHRRTEQAASTLRRVGSAHVPLAEAEDTTLIAFRPEDGGSEHLALVIGVPGPAAPALVRLHSQCFTGDLLGSLRCDCGDQLRGAVRRIAEAGGGVLLYLAQEGRGIGLVNKLRAYTLQDRGHNTFHANEMLGFDADERHYRTAAEMLRQLEFLRIRLLTNNPEKITALRRCGIDVVERIPHNFPPNPHNQRYLEAKAERGHMI